MDSLFVSIRAAAFALGFSLVCQAPSRAEEPKPAPCNQDAMIVFDASGSMAGVVGGGIATSITRIDEVRSALAAVLPSATRFRRVGLITYGAGPYNRCNVHLDFPPTPNAAQAIMRVVNALTPNGKTPLTSAVAQAAEVLDYRTKPGLIVVITDGEETCGGLPCVLAKQLHDEAEQLAIHIISYRTKGYSWTGESVLDMMCLADQNNGLFISADSKQELIEALEKTLDCPIISQRGAPWTSLAR
jgi:Ca-activated chloride channel family protein